MPRLMRTVARTAVVAGTATAVSNRVSRRQAGRWNDQQAAQQQAAAPQYAEPQYAPPPPPPAPPAGATPTTSSPSCPSSAPCVTPAS